MPYSYNVYTGNGSNTQFTIGFPYIRREHVKVYVAYVDTAYTYVNNTTVQLATAPGAGVRVEVRRVTPFANVLVDFADGSTLVAADLDTSNLQHLYLEQELDDASKQGIYVDPASGQLTAGGQQIKNVADPTAAQDAATKAYVDTADALRLKRDGTQAMTGALPMGGFKVTGAADPTSAQDLATKAYVDTTTVASAGDSMTGNLAMGGNKVTGLGTTSSASDAATKTYVDNNAVIYSGSPAFTQDGAGAVTRSWSSKLKDVVSVKDFGAVGDGITDDYNAIKNAVAALQTAGSGTLFFPRGTYFINQYRIDGGPSANGIVNFALQNLNNVCISGYGAKLVMKGGWTRTADYSSGGFTFSYSNNIGFAFTNCTNLTVEGLEVDGGANTIVKQATAEGVSYGVMLFGCTQVSLRDLYIHHYCTDGLLVDMTGPITAFKVSRQVHAVNCRFNNNGRQGMSIIQLRHATFTNCDFSFTGTTGTYGGHSPQAGVDIEPNYIHDNPTAPLNIAGDDSTGDISFIGCRFKDNLGFEFVGSSRDSVQHPVQFFGCLFQNTNNSSPQVVSATRLTRFYACNFDDVSIYPGYTFNDDNTTELHECTIISRRNNYAILHAQANPTLIVRNCDIQLMAPSSTAGTYRIYIQSSKCDFLNNKVFISAAEHGSATFQIICLVQSVRKSIDNRFSTNLATASKLFTVSNDLAVTVNDYYEQPTYISPGTSAWPTNEYLAGVTLTSAQVKNNSSGKSIYHGAAAPVSGTYVLGDRFINTAPSVNGTAEWICTAGGTPGTWTPLPLPNSAIAKTVDFGYKNGAVTSVIFEFVSNSGSGSCIAEITVGGYQDATRVIVAKYSNQAAIVMQNTGGQTITTSSSANGGLKVEIAISVTHPCVTATATVGGLATGFSTDPTISFV